MWDDISEDKYETRYFSKVVEVGEVRSKLDEIRNILSKDLVDNVDVNICVDIPTALIYFYLTKSGEHKPIRSNIMLQVQEIREQFRAMKKKWYTDSGFRIKETEYSLHQYTKVLESSVSEKFKSLDCDIKFTFYDINNRNGDLFINTFKSIDK